MICWCFNNSVPCWSFWGGLCTRGTGWRFAVPLLETECRRDRDFVVFLYQRQGWQISGILFYGYQLWEVIVNIDIFLRIYVVRVGQKSVDKFASYKKKIYFTKNQQLKVNVQNAGHVARYISNIGTGWRRATHFLPCVQF